VTATLGPLVASAAPLYPVAAYANASEALGAIGTDAVFACSGRASARLLSAAGNVVYSYEFNDPAAPQALPGQLSFKSGAAHTSELPYLFTMPGSAALSPAQRGLADTMVRYWTRFARTGNPNEAAATVWPAYTAANDAYLSLAPSVAVTTNFATDHQCAVWTPGV
jgi:para-nitrobenzyl esterase